MSVKYPKILKKQLCEDICFNGKSTLKMADDYGIPIKTLEKWITAFAFITRLLRYLLPTDFKSIRSYGFYNKSNKLCDNIKYVISKEKIKIKRELLKWKNLILNSFNRIPTICPNCKQIMEPLFEVS